MRIRAMQKKDINAAAKIFGTYGTAFDTKRSRHYFKTSLDAKERKKQFTYLNYWVAEEKGKVIGVTGLYNLKAWPRHNAWLGYFAVAEKWRGKGVGSALYNAMEKQAEKMGVRIFCLETSTKHYKDDAGKFYRKKGFKIVGRIKDYWGKGDDQIYMSKRIKK